MGSRDADLWKIVESGTLAEVKAALAAGANVNARKGKQSVLDLAIRMRKRDDVAAALIEAGADLGASKDQIVWAATQPLPVLEAFIRGGATVNAMSFAGSPLQVAARAGLLPQVERLLAAGAEPNAGTMIGNPLTDAARNGHSACALALVRGGATLAAAEAFGPLLPVLIELAETAIVKALLDAGADVNRRYTLQGPQSKLKFAQAKQARAGLAKSLEAMTSAVSRALTGSEDHGADADEDDGESYEEMEARVNRELEEKVQQATRVRLAGVTPLMVAAAEGLTELVDALLARGAEPNALDDAGRTAIRHAETAGHAAVVTRLREAGARAEVELPPGSSLMLAAEAGDAAGIRAALARGARIDAHDDREAADGKTALVQAVASGSADAVRALIAGGAALDQKAKKSPHNVRAIFDGESQERTPLHVAAAAGRETIVTLLLESGAEKDARDEERGTPLHLAAAGNQLAALRLLIAAGAELDAKDKDGMTPLLFAAARGHADVGLALLAAGADARAATRAKESALHYAVSAKCAPLVRALVEHGADPLAKNEYGSTPMERGEHYPELAKALSAARVKDPREAKPSVRPAKAGKTMKPRRR